MLTPLQMDMEPENHRWLRQFSSTTQWVWGSVVLSRASISVYPHIFAQDRTSRTAKIALASALLSVYLAHERRGVPPLDAASPAPAAFSGPSGAGNARDGLQATCLCQGIHHLPATLMFTRPQVPRI